MTVGRRALLLPAAALAALAAGLLAPHPLGPRLLYAGLIVTGTPVVWRTIRGAIARRFAADLVASLAIVGAALLDQPVAGLIVVLMQTGGEALETLAQRRASDAVRELEAAAPRVAHRWNGDRLEDIRADQIVVGDRLLVRPGELVPCDGDVLEGESDVDASGITGEPVPIPAGPGTHLLSGSLNGEGALTLQATAPASESQYARIVELVRTAQASKAPLQRLADRYAIWFTPVTLLVCLATYLATGDAVRVLAVLVVATPCPLILATPVAVVGGISRAARRHVIFRHGEALERLGRADVAAFDKTGTLTIGRPEVAAVRALPPHTSDGLLRLAAGVEQGSGHLLARSVVTAASRDGRGIPPATEIQEAPGQGVSGRVEGLRIMVGSFAYVARRHPEAAAELARLQDGATLQAYVTVDGMPAGIIRYADRPRAEAPILMARLRRMGLPRTLLLSGDRRENAAEVAKAVGIEEVHADLLPGDKVATIARLEEAGHRVLMVGDGTNDAPALAAASVGVALASGGGGISAEAAGVVLLADDLGLVAEAVDISRRTMRIARQSIWTGLGLSGVAMGFAAAGLVTPTLGAILQEVIDLAVIVNALRASGSGTPYGL